jgi:hypothetical protein
MTPTRRAQSAAPTLRRDFALKIHLTFTHPAQPLAMSFRQS